MGIFARFRRQQPYQPITASIINQGVDAAEWATRIRVTSPLQMKSGPGGPLIAMAPVSKGYLCVANGAIPARSGSAYGVGSVKIVQVQATFSAGNMTACAGTTSSVVVQVYNPSSNTMTSGNGIDSGQYCWAQQDASGFYCVTPLECS